MIRLYSALFSSRQLPSRRPTWRLSSKRVHQTRKAKTMLSPDWLLKFLLTSFAPATKNVRRENYPRL